jgi:putative isomerase
MKSYQPILLILFALTYFSCQHIQTSDSQFHTTIPDNVINYQKHKDSKGNELAFAFSDQGAWFGYGLPDSSSNKIGFTGPFLMTQENGTWSSKALSHLVLMDENRKPISFNSSCRSYNSHLEITWKNKDLELRQYLFFVDELTAITATKIINLSNEEISLTPQINGTINNKTLHLNSKGNTIIINSKKSDATGFFKFLNKVINQNITDTSYHLALQNIQIKPDKETDIIWSQSFVFEQDIKEFNTKNVNRQMQDWQNLLQANINKKEKEFIKLRSKLKEEFKDSAYDILLAKALLTLQNNYRAPSGELKHAGIFPSYHYEWFHGFWAWDSWKHAVALAQYDTEKAKDQIRAMIDYIEPNGFIPDCIYRDTTIEKHNYRNSKPPLFSRAVWEIYKNDADKYFLEEMLPSLLLQHSWWYINRDHDNDNICEYGSTDGTLIAAKWESGMDNAVRFDYSKLLKNSETAYSLDQESVDLNGYLYADKIYLTEILKELDQLELGMRFQLEVKILKQKIQTQFFDSVTNWFYDTDISGKSFIKTKGCEGWIPLWANVATTNQAEKIVEKMMDTAYFFNQVPFQTLSASESKFKPFRGYWRGPVWVDQAYFGIKGLQNYSFNKEAIQATHQMLHNAEGLMEKGPAIRENYNPITGEGMEAYNFSWSAAHFMLMILDNGSMI